MPENALGDYSRPRISLLTITELEGGGSVLLRELEYCLKTAVYEAKLGFI